MRRFTVWLFSVTLFLSAFLLFCVQPMIAKMVLPLLGGAPAVWSTCMVFFQAALLAGYAYAHATTWLGVRRQAILQVALVWLPLLVLPFGIHADAARSLSAEANPTGWLLGLLVGAVGLPFVVVSTSAPLLQRWFGESGHPAAADPYFLYSASNLGSLLALLAYPLVVEPNMHLAQQSSAWAAGYALFAALTVTCAITLWKSRVQTAPVPISSVPAQELTPLRFGQFLHWIVLAFIPSSLLLGVTTYLTTDIAAIPLLWVIPLALYLLTFILTFARRPPLSHAAMKRALPMAAVVLALAMNVSTMMLRIFIPIHLLAFFLAAMVCHGELVRSRPSGEHLTAFYLSMSLGGVLGGLFNALLAPIIFDRIAEYPLALVLACLILPGTTSLANSLWSRFLDWALPLILGTLLWGLLALIQTRSNSDQRAPLAMIVFGLAALACYTLRERSLRFGLGIAAVLMAGGTYASDFGQVLFRNRDYFGVLRVTRVMPEGYHRLIHGHTLHGQQSLDPLRRREPLTYYHLTGPIGQLFEVFGKRIARSNIGIVGLGAGSLACYAEPGQRWTSYEIDPTVEKVARDPRYFTFLQECQAESMNVILGDARLRLGEAPEHSYGLIVLDAFSSDAIPTHLLTREALRLYLSKLADGGIIAFHISNNYLDLGPILGTLASDAGLTCRVRRDLDIPPDDLRLGKSASIWAVVAASAADLGGLVEDPRWVSPPIRRHETVWTDDFSNIIEHFNLK